MLGVVGAPAKRQLEDAIFNATATSSDKQLTPDGLLAAVRRLSGQPDLSRHRADWLMSRFGRDQRADKEAFRKISAYLTRGHNVQEELAEAWAQLEQVQQERERLQLELSAANLAVASIREPGSAAAADADVNDAPLAEAVAAARAALESADEHTARGWTAERWVGSLPVAELLSKLLFSPLPADLSGVAAAELGFARALGCHPDATARREALLRLFHSHETAAALVDLIDHGARQLAAAEAATGSELHSKFSYSGAFPLKFAPVRSFFLGLDGLLGPPAHNMREAIKDEHCSAADSHTPFEGLNYKFETTSNTEYWFVAAPHDAKGTLRLGPSGLYPGECAVADLGDNRTARGWLGLEPHWTSGSTRVPRLITPLSQLTCAVRDSLHTLAGVARPLEVFDAALKETNSQLASLGEPAVSVVELLCGRLYTGPLYVKYNLVLRTKGTEASEQMMAQEERLCAGNTYATTLQVLNSAIIKLSKLTPAIKVYRGVAGGVLPPSFWSTDGNSHGGGIECAFMSASTDRSVALTYARISRGVAAPMLLELKLGMIDRGADFSWLSQYPSEAEVLFPALTGLEMQDSRVEDGVLVVSLRVSINLTALPIEQTLARMKRSHLDLCDLMLHDLNAVVPNSVLVGLSSLRDQAASRDAEWFNLSSHFRDATHAALDARQSVLDGLSRPEIWQSERAAFGLEFACARMRQAAELCARAGKVQGAKELLTRSLAWELMPPNPPSPDLTLRHRQSTYPPQDGMDSGSAPPPSSSAAGSPGGGTMRPPLLARLGSSAGSGALGGSGSGSALGEASSPSRRLSSAMNSMRKRVSLGFTRFRESRERVVPGGGSEPDTWVAEACAEAGDVVLSSEQNVLIQTALILLEHGATPPWPAVIAKLTEGDPIIAKTVAVLMKHRRQRRKFDPFAPQARVSAWHKASALFTEATIVKALPDGSFEVAMAGEMKSAVLSKYHVLSISSEGDGAVLRAAASMGLTTFVVALLASGTSVFEAHPGQVTALHMAAAAGHADTCRVLMNAGADPLQEDCSQRTPHSLAIAGHHSCVRRALEPSASDLDVLEAEVEEARKVQAGTATTRERMFSTVHEGGGEAEEQLARISRISVTSRERNSKHSKHSKLVETSRQWDQTEAPRESANPLDTAAVTPLMMACRAGDLVEVVRLLEQGDGPSLAAAVSRRGCTALTMAADMGRVEVVTELLKRGVSRPDEAVKDGTTALMLACRYGHASTVDVLIAHGASVHTPSSTNNTAITIASGNGFSDLVEKLISLGASVHLALTTGWTPLHCAADGGFGPVVRLLLAAEADPSSATKKKQSTPLILAARKGNLMALSAFLELGAIIDHPRTDGTTALMSAARNGHDVAVRRLLKAGASTMMQDVQGATAMSYAAAHGHEAVLGAICEVSRATLYVTDLEGRTPLHIAVRSGQVSSTRALLANGARVDASSRRGMQPLHAAAHLNDPDVALVLLRAKADPNASNHSGNRPLHLASEDGNTQVMRVLLDADADPNAATEDGITPLMLSALNGQVEAVAVLIGARGIDVDACCDSRHDGRSTALTLAAKAKHGEVERLLREAGATDVPSSARSHSGGGRDNGGGSGDDAEDGQAIGRDATESSSKEFRAIPLLRSNVGSSTSLLRLQMSAADVLRNATSVHESKTSPSPDLQ